MSIQIRISAGGVTAIGRILGDTEQLKQALIGSTVTIEAA